MKTLNDRIDYAVFIISHGRPNEQKTYNFLNSKNVPNLFIVCDDVDSSLEEYKKNYGEKVLVFHKQKYMDELDAFYNDPTPSRCTYARNASTDFGVSMGYRFFAILDDDMSSVRIRTEEMERSVDDIDGAFQAVFRFIRDAGLYMYMGAISSSFFGGFKHELLYSGGCAFFCDATKRVTWLSQYYEDMVTPNAYNRVGKIICSTRHLHFNFITDGSNSGGIDYEGQRQRYNFSLGSLIGSPAELKIIYRGPTDLVTQRPKNTHPMILDEKWRKPRS